MAARYELEVTIASAKNLKNTNWRYGPLKPYAVVWVDPQNKCSTPVDYVGDESPVWNEKLTIPLNGRIEDSTLYVDIVHANAAEDTKPLVGSAKLKLKDVVDEVGIGELFADGLKLKRPSGRPHGKLEVKVSVREPRYRPRDPYSYGAPPPQYNYNQPPPPQQPYGGNYPPSEYSPYGAPPQPQYGAPPQPQYGAPPQPQYVAPPQPQYGQGYEQPAEYYGGQPSYKEEEKEKKSKYGMGTGLAVGAAAGLLGGLAIAEGIDYLRDESEEDAAEKVEEDLGYDDDE